MMTVSQKKPGNILFVTMVLLIVSSIMGLLIVYYMKAMILLTGNFHDYFEAYYNANAGVELGLTQIVARQSYGFEKSEASFDSILESNGFLSKTTNNPKNKTVASIKSFGRVYADDFVYGPSQTCAGLHYKTLSQGEPILLPLYKDNKSDSQSFKQVDVNSDFAPITVGSLGGFKIGGNALGTVQGKLIEGVIGTDFLVASSKSSEEQGLTTATQLTPQDPNSNFLAFLKTNADVGAVCLEFNQSIPLPFYLISSTSTYGRTRIILQGYKKNERIGEFLYTAIASNTN